ncbi:hypothetical protein [Corynebacterium oculi]|nr:hypothetical protein [Corynebacterium oculi]
MAPLAPLIDAAPPARPQPLVLVVLPVWLVCGRLPFSPRPNTKGCQ